MTTVALSAHVNKGKVQLDEPYALPDQARLVVVVLPENQERQDWARLAVRELGRAYGNAEPDYTTADLRP